MGVSAQELSTGDDSWFANEATHFVQDKFSGILDTFHGTDADAARDGSSWWHDLAIDDDEFLHAGSPGRTPDQLVKGKQDLVGVGPIELKGSVPREDWYWHNDAKYRVGTMRATGSIEAKAGKARRLYNERRNHWSNPKLHLDQLLPLLPAKSISENQHQKQKEEYETDL